MRNFANPFYLGIILWAVCFVGYSLAWSGLCQALDFQLIIFLCYLSAMLFVCGFLYKHMGFNRIEEASKEPKTLKLTVAVSLILFSGMLIEGTVPLVNVASGMAYNSENVGLPYIGAFATALALFQGFRVSMLFFKTKDWQYLLEFALLFLPLVLMVQRQNLVIMFAGFVYSWVIMREKASLTIGKKAVAVLGVFFIVAVGLFIFGAIGNVRYGIWSWDDSSMIAAVGYMNGNYPEWLPGEYFWTYIYVVTPLANLNNNILLGNDIGSLTALLAQFFPTSITKFWGYSAIPTFLYQPSLTVSTAFMQPFLCIGYAGMYIYTSAILVVLFAVGIGSKKLSASNRFAVNASVCYFISMMLFDNPSTYLTTSYLLLICICLCCYKALKRKGRRSVIK